MVLIARHGFFSVENCGKSGKKAKTRQLFVIIVSFVGFFLMKCKEWAPFSVKRSSSVAYCAKSWGLKGESSDLQLS